MAELVSTAIAREEALERIEKAHTRRKNAVADAKKRAHEIDLKLGEQIKAGMRAGLTAKQIQRRIGLSLPRIYQLRDLWQEHIDKEFGLT